MPIPILRVNLQDATGKNVDVEPAQYNGLNYDLLSGLLPHVNSGSKNIKVSNSDASFLFNFWKNSDITKDGDVNDYPSHFSNSDILRLKALGFVSGDESLKFTGRGKDVIKNIVLNEENNFLDGKVNKPYTEILAKMDSNRKQKVRLALGR